MDESKHNLEKIIKLFNECLMKGTWQIRYADAKSFCPFPKYLPNIYCSYFGKHRCVESEHGNFNTYDCEYDDKAAT
jgi:hypothetical protein